ncbi:glutathione S-transferase [Pseudomonas sp. StFLB209]|uniref:glutathione S-transferase N-terminal domain-containing protein n=1 Tax=Pseudomonas sp. StFLB209 TaxID=1028989 RepID=UPI0004F7A3D0|nr:glutathione S-transferase N-terminal domain-containing protein [Pseudomonas sp. StFLB209]BAP43316.1 glutathione S-transferase [Pseudomonas sp. StFLB209]
MLKLFGKSTSINVRKVLWACAELNIPLSHEQANGDDVQHLNPNALVPVIDDAGFVLWESNSIIRYLANREQAGWLYPAVAAQRARVDQWIDWQAADLNRTWSYAFMALVRRSPAHDDPAQIRASVQNWNCSMEILDRQLAVTGGHAVGAQFSLADVPVGLSVNRWYETPIDHPDLPNVRAYYERLAERPGYQAFGRNGTP